jgi:peroxiredoxin Q/BCP
LSNTENTVSLSQFKGKKVVLYFYPKDNTPGCTVEANEFREVQPELESAGAVVLGVSPDSIKSHCKFVQKLDLNFQLLADVEHAVSEKYGVWVEKNMCGKRYMGIQRTTFLIDGTGKVARVWEKVTPKGHAHEVLDAVKKPA